MYTIIGLENESGRGRFARHAIGSRFLDYVYEQGSFSGWSQDGYIEYANGTCAGRQVRLLRLTSGKLNECGKSLRQYLLDTPNPVQVIVVHDEAGKDSGDYCFSSTDNWNNGHLGLKSLVKETQLNLFARGGIGIGKIPKSRNDFEEFFNSELNGSIKESIGNTFPCLLEDISVHMESSISRSEMIPTEVLRQSQIPGRMQNLWIFPRCIKVSSQQTRAIDKAVTVLIRVIQKAAKQYAKACEHDSDNKLVKLLESGIPREMIPWVRRQSFHIENFSFDFQSGKLIEINPGPLPLFPPDKIKAVLGVPGPGNVHVTPEVLCRRILHIANRSKQGNDQPTITILSRVAGGAAAGDGGWIIAVRQYLEECGYGVRVGERQDGDRVVWANITWMTPDRLPDVLGNNTPGVVKIFPSPRNFLFTSKRFLSILSSTEGRETLGVSADDSNVLDEIIPWTQVLSTERNTIQWALRNGHRLYAKPYLSSGGIGGKEVKRISDLKEVLRPAIIQEWIDPYTIPGTGLNYDIRVTVFGTKGEQRTWLPRIWKDTATLQRPMSGILTY